MKFYLKCYFIINFDPILYHIKFILFFLISTPFYFIFEFYLTFHFILNLFYFLKFILF